MELLNCRTAKGSLEYARHHARLDFRVASSLQGQAQDCGVHNQC